MNLVKFYNVLKLGQDIISMLLPVLETIIKRDINGNGKIGE
jgi:hypothetical protein